MYGELFGGLLGGVANIAGSMLSAYQQKKLMKTQAKLNYQYAEKSALNMPSWNRAGLENAGYNPMLAVQNATSGANSSWSSGGSADMPNISDGISQGVANAQSFQRLANETNQADSTVRLNEANARNAIQDSVSKEIHNKYLDNNEKLQLNKLGAETDKLVRETSFFDQLAENMEAERRLQEMGINKDFIARIYSADKSYAGTVYNADTNERNNKRTNRVNTSLEHIRHPYSSFAHKSYTSGKDYKGSHSDPWKK